MNEVLTKIDKSLVGSDAAEKASKTVWANMSYVRPTNERPHSYAYQPPQGLPWESHEYETHFVSIRDARHELIQPSIDREGFQLINAPTEVVDFMDEEEVKSTYYKEARDLVLSVTHAKEAYVFDHLVRRRDPHEVALSFGKRRIDAPAPANGRIHNDYTETSGRRRLPLAIVDANVSSKVKRFSIVNVWRSIRGPVLDTPLALCDARTVNASDLVVCDVRYESRTGEIYLSSFSESHRWSYFSKMDLDEALIFKQYDSQVNGVTRFTPHAAFDHPDTPRGTPPRESIELRCLVTYN